MCSKESRRKERRQKRTWWRGLSPPEPRRRSALCVCVAAPCCAERRRAAAPQLAAAARRLPQVRGLRAASPRSRRRPAPARQPRAACRRRRAVWHCARVLRRACRSRGRRLPSGGGACAQSFTTARAARHARSARCNCSVAAARPRRDVKAQRLSIAKPLVVVGPMCGESGMCYVVAIRHTHEAGVMQVRCAAGAASWRPHRARGRGQSAGPASQPKACPCWASRRAEPRVRATCPPPGPRPLRLRGERCCAARPVACADLPAARRGRGGRRTSRGSERCRACAVLGCARRAQSNPFSVPFQEALRELRAGEGASMFSFDNAVFTIK